MDNMSNLLAVFSFMKQLDEQMKNYKTQYGAVPLSYTYTYELLLYKVMELLGGATSVIEVFRGQSSAIVALIISMSAPVDDPALKDLNDEITKAHDEKTKEATKAPIPGSFEELIRMCKRLGVAPDPKIPSKEGDRQIDEYLKRKTQSKKETTKRSKKHASRLRRPRHNL